MPNRSAGRNESTGRCSARWPADDLALTRCLLPVSVFVVVAAVGAPSPCYTPSSVVFDSAFLPVTLPSLGHVTHMARRSILVKQWCELWAAGESVEACLEDLRQKRTAHWEPMHTLSLQRNLRFDVRVQGVGDSLHAALKSAHRASILSALGFAASPVVGHNDLTSGVKLILFLDVGSLVANPSRQVRRAYFARVLIDSGNDLEQRYRLNARACIGPTSMPPNLSFIMCNLGQVTRRSIVLDPFVGTGSLLVAAAHFGARCFGADIDWKLLSGRTRKGPQTLFDNFKQYGFNPPDILCADLKHAPWSRRRAGWIDAIICDPPYGVRAGARKLGRAATTAAAVATDDVDGAAEKKSKLDAASSSASPAPGAAVAAPSYLATQLYEVDDVVSDLLDLAASLLRVGGRLVYWLPMPGDEALSGRSTSSASASLVYPRHHLLRLVSVSQQAVRLAFNRCLICMEKRATPCSEEEEGFAKAAGAASSTSSAGSSTPTAAPAVSLNHAKRLAKVARRREKKAVAAGAQAPSSAAHSVEGADAASLPTPAAVHL